MVPKLVFACVKRVFPSGTAMILIFFCRKFFLCFVILIKFWLVRLLIPHCFVVVVFSMVKEMPDFSYDIDVISTFTPCGALQKFTAYERNLQDLCFNMFA